MRSIADRASCMSNTLAGRDARLPRRPGSLCSARRWRPLSTGAKETRDIFHLFPKIFRKLQPAISGSICVENAIKRLQRPRPIRENLVNVKKSTPARAGNQPWRVVVVGDTVVSEQGLVAIIGRDPRYRVCGAAHTFEEAN